MPSSPCSGCVRLARHLFCFVVATAGLVPTSVARASHRATLERLIPTLPGEASFVVDRPNVRPMQGSVAASLLLDEAHNVLLLRRLQQDGGTRPLPAAISDAWTGHLQVTTSLRDRWNLALALPVALLQRGTARMGLGPAGAFALGDVRLSVQLRLTRADRLRRPVLYAGAHAWLPVRGSTSFSENLPRILPKITITGWANSWLTYSGGIGVLVRQGVHVGALAPQPGTHVGTELHLGGALSFVDPTRRWWLGPEATLQTTVTSKKPFSRVGSAVELLAGAHRRVFAQWWVGAGVGIGALSAPGTPALRATFRVDYRPPPPPPQTLRATQPPVPMPIVPQPRSMQTGEAAPTLPTSAPERMTTAPQVEGAKEVDP